jgi:hypothetical protein
MKKVDELTKHRREMDRVRENISGHTVCRRIVKCPNIVQLEILRPTFKNFTLSATGFGNFLLTVLIFPMNVGSKKDR